MEYITNNWETILVILTSTVTFASAIANTTANETDNTIVFWFAKIVDLLALNFTTKPVEKK